MTSHQHSSWSKTILKKQATNRKPRYEPMSSAHLNDLGLCLSSSYSGGRSYTGKASSSDSSTIIGTSPGIDVAVTLLASSARGDPVSPSGRAGGSGSSGLHEKFELSRSLGCAGGRGSMDVYGPRRGGINGLLESYQIWGSGPERAGRCGGIELIRSLYTGL